MILDVATTRLGLKLRKEGNEWRGVSIAPGEHSHDNGFSLDAEKGIWNDFSLGTGGDVLRLVAFAKFGNDDGHSLYEAAKFLEGDNFGSNHRFYGQYIYDQTTFLADIKKYHEALKTDEKTLDYLHSRRINDDTIERFMIGVGNLYNGINGKEKRLSCPYFSQYNKPIYMVSRQLPGESLPGAENGKYAKLKKDGKYKLYIKHELFGLNTIPLKDEDCDTLILGEGVFDFFSAAQEGYSALFFIGKPANKHIAQAVQIARKFRRIITCFDIDNNKSGQNFTCMVGRELLKAGINFYCIESYGEGNKDLSDFYTNGGNIQELFDSAVNGYLFMAGLTFWSKTSQDLQTLSEYTPFARLSKNEQLQMLSEVKKFVRALSNITLDPLDRSKILAVLRSYFPEEKIKKFQEPPSKHELLSDWKDEFLEGKHIFFNGSIKGGAFFEYKPVGYWDRLTDADMQGELSKFFRHDLDNRTISALTMMIRLQDTRKPLPEFNKGRVWNFANGTLELDTGVLREPNPDDYLRFQVGYSYDEKAECPVFDKFIRDITCNEPSRENFLLDMIGYVLYDDNALQKLFFLIGEGNNGKSTFIEMIKDLVRNIYGEKDNQTYTTIEPAKLSEDTKAIMLKNSFVNLCYDITTDLKDTSALKKLATNDQLAGNLKFYDTESFSTRAKIICSANEMIKANEDTKALRRRLMFCRFANDFTHNPDTKMNEKLRAELPGIFNKVYRAYLELRKRGFIRPCVDQDEFIAQFSFTNNPVAEFWEENEGEYLSGGEVRKSKVFDAFKQFCERNGKNAGDSSRFFEKLRRVTADKGVTMQDTRHREGNSQPYFCRFMSNTQNSVLDAEKIEEIDE